jgi:hypothetical protein
MCNHLSQNLHRARSKEAIFRRLVAQMLSLSVLSLAWQPALRAPLLTAAPLLDRGLPLLRMDEGKKWEAPWKSINEANKMRVTKKEPPKVRPRKMPKAALELTETFKKDPSRAQLDQLWGAMIACYGTEELALRAATQNTQIINPLYSFTNTMLASRDVLVNMMGKEEALEVMLLTPAVLQCGPSLDTLGPDEIKGFARIRALGNKVPQQVQQYLIFGTLFLVLVPVLAKQAVLNGADFDYENGAAFMILRPLVGIFFAVLIEGSRLAIVGTIVKAKVTGDERVEIARQNEARRMGKGKKQFGRAGSR